MQSFQFKSTLSISREKLWVAMWSFEHINKELAPIIRMSPPEIVLSSIDVKAIPLNVHLFKSNIFLLYIIPVDRHSFKLKDIKEFEFFAETSSSWMMKQWNHQRDLTSIGNQTLLVDTIEFQHRIKFLGKILYPIYKMIFKHRHKKLQTFYNS